MVTPFFAKSTRQQAIQKSRHDHFPFQKIFVISIQKSDDLFSFFTHLLRCSAAKKFQLRQKVSY
jgi:hypothetical protein